MSESPNHQPKGNATENLLFGAVLAYSAGKVTKDAIVRHRADRARYKAFLANEQTHRINPQPDSVIEPQQAAKPEKRVDGPEQRRLRSTASYIRSFFKTPYSSRKIIPREGVNSCPWAYGNAPSYRSLHRDQSETTRPGEYSSGMKYLIALGEKPLRTAIAESKAQNPDEPWRTLISEAGLMRAVDRTKNEETAKKENGQLVGVMAAIEGIGFDTSDLAFAQWETGDTKFAVVPYDPSNVLHRVVSSGEPINTYSDPGLQIRYAGDEYGRNISIDVRPVDIDQLRAEKSGLIPDVTPNPRELSGLDFAVA